MLDSQRSEHGLIIGMGPGIMVPAPPVQFVINLMGLVFRPDAGHMPELSIDSDHQDWLAVFNQQVGVFAGAVWVTGVFA